MVTPVNLYSFMEEIYTNTAFTCAHSHTDHITPFRLGDRQTLHTPECAQIQYMQALRFENQIQQACKKKKHKEIIEYCLKLAGSNACTPVCCFEGVIHWR